MTSTMVVSLAAEIPLNERKSGYEFMGPESRAMQDDDPLDPVRQAELAARFLDGTRSNSLVDRTWAAWRG